MTTGYSGSFALNGANFILQPSTSHWVERDIMGLDGNAHPVYPVYREYEMAWELAHPADVKQIIDVYNYLGNTGTTSFDLPEWGASDYLYHEYSGCTLQEPTVGDYFNGWITGVRLLIMKVRA
jgi:hypothetical protein